MTDTTKPGPWIGWNGGECPEHPETIVETRLECGSVIRKKAADLMWERVGTPHDIIVYRVIKEHREPREFWLARANPISSFTVYSQHPNWECHEVIHVREVLE